MQNFEYDPAYISASSWDGTIKVWELNSNYNSIESKFQGDTQMEHCVLGHCWSPDNSFIFGACGDNAVKMWDLKANTVTKIGEHNS